MAPMPVPYDVALAIVERVERNGRGEINYPTLAAFALVNRACAQASAKALYAEIIVRPSTDYVVSDWVKSSLLPHNLGYVVSFRLEGNLTYRVSELDAVLARATGLWPNLSSVVFDPPVDHYGTTRFAKVADALIERHEGIKKLLLGGSACILWGRRDSLPTSPVLEQLRLQSPARTILELIPEWLGAERSPKLTWFEISGYCHYVDSSELRRLAKPLRNIRVLSLDYSNLVGQPDIVNLIGALPHLSSLALDLGPTNMGGRPVKRVPALSSLESLMLKHKLATSSSETAAFCTFVRRLIAGSRLQKFVSITSDEPWSNDCPAVAHDALLHHISSRHAQTFEVLSAPRLFFRKDVVVHLTQACTRLRDLSLTTRTTSILGLIHHGTSLTSATVNIHKRPHHRMLESIDEAYVREVLTKIPALRQLGINDRMWRTKIDGGLAVEVLQTYQRRRVRW